MIREEIERLGRFPAEQEAIRAKCFHSSGLFEEFAKEEIEQSITERFGKMARRYPDRVAIKNGAELITYRQLNGFANAVAATILDQKGGEVAPVGIFIQKGCSLFAVILGVLKAGRSVVLLDSSFPDSRIAALLEDARVEWVISDRQNLSLAKNFAGYRCGVLEMEPMEGDILTADVDLLVEPTAVAFLMYTSGSTGHPKGVIWNHRNVLHNIMQLTNTYHLCQEDRVSLFTSGTGNVVTNSFVALLNGATVLPFDVQKEGVSPLAAWLLSEKITVCAISAPVFRKFAASLTEETGFPDLRILRLTSESAYKRDIDLYKKYFSSNCLLVNGIIPTETGLLRTYFMDCNTKVSGTELPLGYAVEDKEILIWDDSGKPLGFNEVGEIVVRSCYLAPGYWRNPDLTDTKFKPDSNGGEERLYLTGDMGLMLPGGELVHKGRKDFRVKIRGYGVDITEIERTLLTHDSVREVAVVPRQSESGEAYLVAYLTSNTQRAPTVSELRNVLKEHLAEYMIPSRFITLDALPMTPSGKVNRQALPAPDHSRPALKSIYVEATTSIEKALVNIWENILGVSPIGIHDNFFDLGGHSLVATTVVAKLKEELGVDFQIGEFVSFPTVERLACHIDNVRSSKAREIYSYLVQLQPGHGRAPIYFLPGGIGGNAEFFVYARLARHVGSEFPFYGLKPRSATGAQRSQDRVDEIAADYLSEIRSFQPQGPYYIIGECGGGIIAYEIAQQLQRQGQELAFLALMDIPRPDIFLELRRRFNRRFRPVFESRYFRGLILLLQQLHHRGFKEKISYLANNSAKIIEELTRPEERLPRRNVYKRLEYVQRSYSRAIYRYRPKSYTGKMVLLINEENDGDEPTLGWKDVVTGGIEVCKVRGDHNTYIRDHVQSTAGRLREYLEAADSKASRCIVV